MNTYGTPIYKASDADRLLQYIRRCNRARAGLSPSSPRARYYRDEALNALRRINAIAKEAA